MNKKVFFTKYLTKKALRKQIKDFALSRNVKCVVFNSKSKDLNGTYTTPSKVIFINNRQTKHSLLATFFHELAHHTAVERRWWKSFHYDLKLFTPEQTFFIENKIDKLAKKLWNAHVNMRHWGKYTYAYPKTRKTQLTTWIKHRASK